MHHFDIKMTLNCQDVQILMDGRPLSGVKGFRVECGDGHTSRIILEIAASADLIGEAQVWVKDETQELFDKAEAAEDRADVAEARADAAEAKVPNIEHGTLAYIVPVPQETRDAAEGKSRK